MMAGFKSLVRGTRKDICNCLTERVFFTVSYTTSLILSIGVRFKVT
ncbi:MAG: hypothetical protein K0R96_2507 [Pantoea agglomerans]|nr:hypothetical protein [Pantoea agglomerans]